MHNSKALLHSLEQTLVLRKLVTAYLPTSLNVEFSKTCFLKKRLPLICVTLAIAKPPFKENISRVLNMVKRSQSHAGSWYSSSSNTLNQQLLSWIDEATENGCSQIQSAKVLIAPHAGFSYSGSTAAYAYSSINFNESQGDKTVFLLGPSHHVSLPKQAALTLCDSYETPLGPIQIDRQLCATLYDSGLFTWMDLNVDEDEHSLEMHLPFIRHIFSRGLVSDQSSDCHCKLVPILIGFPSKDQEEALATLLKPYFQTPSSLFIISSDFCHWGTRFGYAQASEGMPIYKSIETIDQMGMALIESQDYDGFHLYLQKTRNTICGRFPICILLKILEMLKRERKECSIKFVRYSQSSKVIRQSDSSVSYASAIGTLF